MNTRLQEMASLRDRIKYHPEIQHRVLAARVAQDDLDNLRRESVASQAQAQAL